MKILSIDSTASSASAAVAEDGHIISSAFLNVGLKHSSTLLHLVDDVLKNASLKAGDIDYFAVNVGPGSFTGVRIGVSFVKGLAFTFNAKCIPVSTLESIAYNMKCFDSYVIAAMDARCNQVYTALFEITSGNVQRITDDDALLMDDLDFIPADPCKPIYVVGDGAKVLYDKIGQSDNNILLASENLIYQNAVSVALCAFDNPDRAVDASELLPLYLRPSQAERNLKN